MLPSSHGGCGITDKCRAWHDPALNSCDDSTGQSDLAGSKSVGYLLESGILCCPCAATKGQEGMETATEGHLTPKSERELWILPGSQSALNVNW